MSNFFQFEVHFSFAPVKVLGLVEVTTNDNFNASDACQFPNVIYDIFFHHQLVEALNPLTNTGFRQFWASSLQMRRTFLGMFGCLGIQRIPNLHPCEFTLWFHVISAIQKTHWKFLPSSHKSLTWSVGPELDIPSPTCEARFFLGWDFFLRFWDPMGFITHEKTTIKGGNILFQPSQTIYQNWVFFLTAIIFQPPVVRFLLGELLQKASKMQIKDDTSIISMTSSSQT